MILMIMEIMNMIVMIIITKDGRLDDVQWIKMEYDQENSVYLFYFIFLFLLTLHLFFMTV